jgi:predicted thioesterase
MGVRAEAVLEKVEGRRLFFRVTAYDDKEKIGEGNHERIVVQRDRFWAKAQAKSS